MTLGEKLQLLRRARGLSQEQLAEALDVSRQAISKWENSDSVPELEKLKAISQYFGVTADYLLFEEQTELQSAADAETRKNDTYREDVRGFARLNVHWLGYTVAIIGAILLLRVMAGMIVQMIFIGGGMAQDGMQGTMMTGRLLAAYLPYLLVYAAMVAGGLLLARWLKKRRETNDDF